MLNYLTFVKKIFYFQIDGKLDEIEDGLENKCFSVAELTVRQFEIDFLTILFDRKSEDELMHEISNLLT